MPPAPASSRTFARRCSLVRIAPQPSALLVVARSVSSYVCQSCGARTRQFFGRCSSCGGWNTLVEQAPVASDNRRRRPLASPDGPEEPKRARRSEPITAVGDRPLQRLASGYGELDRVLGGGLVPGSLVLLGGDPGIGKSTLLLQCARSMAIAQSVLYVSAEESAQQVKLRWSRLADEGEGAPAATKRPAAVGTTREPPLAAPGAARRSSGDPPGPLGVIAPMDGEPPPDGAGLQLLAETDLELVLQELETLRPDVAIIDSIQALHDSEIGRAHV